MTGKRRRKRRAHRVRGTGTAGARNKAARTLQATARQPSQADPDQGASTRRVPFGDGGQRDKLPAARVTPAELEAERTDLPGPTAVSSGRQEGTGRQRAGLLRFPTAVLLPGRAFFAMGRPGPGLVCYALQASLFGWLPAALWAVHAERRLAQKQRGLAARLRPL
jgi:hypothetical protein